MESNHPTNGFGSLQDYAAHDEQGGATYDPRLGTPCGLAAPHAAEAQPMQPIEPFIFNGVAYIEDDIKIFEDFPDYGYAAASAALLDQIQPMDATQQALAPQPAGPPQVQQTAQPAQMAAPMLAPPTVQPLPPQPAARPAPPTLNQSRDIARNYANMATPTGADINWLKGLLRQLSTDETDQDWGDLPSRAQKYFLRVIRSHLTVTGVKEPTAAAIPLLDEFFTNRTGRVLNRQSVSAVISSITRHRNNHNGRQ